MIEFASNILSDQMIRGFLSFFFVSILILFLSSLVKNKSRKYIKDNNFRYRFKKIITLFSYFLIIITLLFVFSSKLGSLTIAIGVAGAGIAFALQEVIVSIAGWLAIIFSNFYSVGDRVSVGDVVGDVIDIGILRTTLMECGQWVGGDQYNGRIVRISNSKIFKDAIFNYSADFPFLWDEIRLPIHYGSDILLIRQILMKLADKELSGFTEYAKEKWDVMVNKYMIENASVEPTIYINANDNWVEVSLRYVVDYKKRRLTKDLLFMKLLHEITNTEGKVKLASSSVEIINFPKSN